MSCFYRSHISFIDICLFVCLFDCLFLVNSLTSTISLTPMLASDKTCYSFFAYQSHIHLHLHRQNSH